MDKKEFATIAMALKTYYPKEQLLPNQQAMELWFRELCDIPYNVAEASIRKWVATNKWSPTIADIREMTSTIVNDDIQDWGAAWQEVMNAIRTYGSYNQSAAMKSLESNAITHLVVNRIGYLELCMSENIEVERANFRMIYEQMVQREKQKAQLPDNLSARIEQIRSDRLMIRKGDEE